MRKRAAIPGFLVDFNSIWNPLLIAFAPKISQESDKSQVQRNSSGLGLIDTKTHPMINLDLLQKYGAKQITLDKDDFIFREGEEALYYFQVIDGSIKMITDSPEGKEFIQGIFKANDSFGEPPLLCAFPYPSTAITLEPSSLVKLAKHRFLNLLRENFEVHLDLDKALCERLKYKSMVLSEISSHDPEHRIMSLLTYLKEERSEIGNTNGGNSQGNHRFIVPFTRQQIANMTGLRVETVIRTVKKMEDEGKLKVVSRKIAL